MKKIFNTLLLTLCFSIAASNTFAVPLSVYDREVAINDASDPVDPQQERSLLPTCQAYQSQSQLEVVFNKYIGEATVLILNHMGSVVGSATANSEYEFTVHLSAPTHNGVYTLRVLGSNGYMGDGTFTIE